MIAETDCIAISNTSYNPFSSPAPDYEAETLEDRQELSKLVVFNDDVNTFEHVIQTLIEVCGHTPEQAEQCTLIIHYRGQYCVKSGEWVELVPLRQAICDRGISAEVTG